MNYYKNAVDAANLLGEAVLGKALLGTKIPYELGKFLPVGYTVEDALIEGALTVGENEEENVLNIIYAPELFSFFVNFYKDCMVKDNLVTSVEYEAQPFGSVVDLLAEDMNKYCPKVTRRSRKTRRSRWGRPRQKTCLTWCSSRSQACCQTIL